MPPRIDKLLKSVQSLPDEDKLWFLAKLLAAMHEDAILDQQHRTVCRSRGVDRRTAHEKKIDERLTKIQDQLMPEHGELVVAINMETGEYALGRDNGEAHKEYMKRWPDGGYFMCRVNGGPAMRMGTGFVPLNR